MSAIAKLLKVASFVICVIVVLSFGAFAIEQTKTGSEHQQKEVSGEVEPTKTSHPGTVHRALDEVSSELTSPFAGVISGSSSEWLIRGVELLLALAVYGFGLGYLARVLRVRV